MTACGFILPFLDEGRCGRISLKYYEKSGSKMRKYLFEAGVDIIFAKKKEMDFMQFLLILAPA